MASLRFSKMGKPKLSGPSTMGTAANAIVHKAMRGAGSAMYSGFNMYAKFNRIHVNNSKYERRVERAYRILLFKFGSSVRSASRRRMGQQSRRYWVRDKVWWNGKKYRSWRYSDPLKSPYSHKRMLKSSVAFAVELRRKNVVVGPLQHAQNIAPLLEYGGKKNILVNWKKSQKGRLIISKKRSEMKRKVVNYKPRPYMRPALHSVIQITLPTLLKKSNLPQYLKNVFYQRATGASHSYGGGKYV